MFEFFNRIKDSVSNIFSNVSNSVASLYNKGKQFVSDIFSKAEFPDMPRQAELFLKSHGKEPITSLSVGRAPVSKMLTKLLDFLSAGRFSAGQKEQNIDDFFHLYIIINDKYRLEKNELMKLSKYVMPDKEERIAVSTPNTNVSLSEFVVAPSKSDPQSYYRNYDAFSNNCQDFVLKVLNYWGINNPQINAFVKQPIEKIAQKLDDTNVKGIARTLTDIGAGINDTLQRVSGGRLGFKRGGIIRDESKRAS